MSKLWAWFVQHNVSTHTLAAIAVALAAAYNLYAPFHTLVMKYFSMLPVDVQTLVLTAFFIGALYKSGALKFTTTTVQKATLETVDSPTMKTTTLETTTSVSPANQNK
jgi:cation transport ATPase